MAQFTKKAIIDTFIELISERPFDKITVKDIVTRCGVNRNTFYYYFADIYALVDEIFQLEIQKIVGNTASYVSWHDAFYKAVDFVAQNKLAVYHLYKSISREQVENYLDRVISNNIESFIRGEAVGLNVDEADIGLLSRFYTHALTGMILEWLNNDMREDAYAAIYRLNFLLDGNIRRSFEKQKNRQSGENV